MSAGARLDRTQLWVPSRVPPSLRTQSPDPACWTLEPGSQRQMNSQMATGFQSVLTGTFCSLPDRVGEGIQRQEVGESLGQVGVIQIEE